MHSLRLIRKPTTPHAPCHCEWTCLDSVATLHCHFALPKRLSQCTVRFARRPVARRHSARRSSSSDRSKTTSLDATKSPSAEQNSMDGNEGRDKPLPVWAVVLIGVLSFLILATVVAIVVVVFACKKKRKRDGKSRESKTEKELAKKKNSKRDKSSELPAGRYPEQLLVDQRDQLDCHRMLHEYLLEGLRKKDAIRGISQLEKETGRVCDTNVTAMRTDAMLRSFVTALAKMDFDVQPRRLMQLVNARRPEIQFRKSTAVFVEDDGGVRYLNMNKLLDFVRRPILVGQAPGEGMLADYWNVIWKQKIGVLVWIGTTASGLEMSSKRYIPSKVGDKMRIDHFEMELISSMQNSVVEFAQHHIKLSRRPSSEKREIVIFHIDRWPTSPTDQGISKLSELLTRAHYCLFKFYPQSETPLRAMMVHCPSGIYQSISFVAMYICRQTWLVSSEMNLLSVVEHIRCNRYQAWTLKPEELLLQIQIVHSVLVQTARSLKAAKAFVKALRKKHHPGLKEKTSGPSTQSYSTPSK